MSRKHTRRKVVVPVPPRGLRPKLLPDQVRDLALAHVVNLDDIASGRASRDVMWQCMGGVLTWLHVAEQLGVGVAVMQQQHALMIELIARYARTGRVLFTGPEYQLAKQGVMTMDLLAERVDRLTALQAADWAEARVNALDAAHRSHQEQTA